MKSWRILVPGAVIVIFGSVIGYNVVKQHMIAEYLANMKAPASPVSVMTVEAKKYQPTLTAIGYIEPNQGLEVASELASRITSINFESGDKVEQGQVLVQLNDSVEQANLKATEAKLSSAYKDYVRFQALVAQKNASQKDLDAAKAQYEYLLAEKASISATIDKMSIKAPFSGTLGIKNVYIGEYVQPGTKIVYLDDSSVVKVRFTLSQSDYSKIAIGQKVEVVADSYPNDKFMGEITALESKTEFSSGIFEVQATLPNDAQKLMTGMYAKVNVLLPEIENTIVLPQTAIAFNLYGETVFVVKEGKNDKGEVEKTVSLVPIVVGERSGDSAIIASGVKPGDVVVTEGQVRISNGSLVYVDDTYKLDKQEQTPML